MSISLNCPCGAHLQIDEKFAGKLIPCPDCQRPLQAVVQTPQYQRTSGLAIASLALGLVGFFTFLGGVVAVVLGYLAQQQIASKPDLVGGQRLALAGMILGGLGCLFTAAGYLVGDRIGVDALLREVRLAPNLDYRLEPDGTYKHTTQHNTLFLQPPSPSWARLQSRGESAFSSKNDLLTLVHVWEDAHLVVLQQIPEGEQDADTLRAKGIEGFRASDLARNLNRLRGHVGEVPEGTATPVADNPSEAILDIRLGGFDRTFLIRVVKHGPDLYILAGGTRAHRFPRLLEQLRKSFDSFKVDI